jgi:hypothetical protein
MAPSSFAAAVVFAAIVFSVCLKGARDEDEDEDEADIAVGVGSLAWLFSSLFAPLFLSFVLLYWFFLCSSWFPPLCLFPSSSLLLLFKSPFGA